jgi:hypothetical protein
MAMAMLARKPLMIEHHGYQAVCFERFAAEQVPGWSLPGSIPQQELRRMSSLWTPMGAAYERSGNW